VVQSAVRCWFMDSSPVAGWYPDPYDVNSLRWWDGEAWSEHTQIAPGADPEPAEVVEVAADSWSSPAPEYDPVPQPPAPQPFEDLDPYGNSRPSHLPPGPYDSTDPHGGAVVGYGTWAANQPTEDLNTPPGAFAQTGYGPAWDPYNQSQVPGVPHSGPGAHPQQQAHPYNYGQQSVPPPGQAYGYNTPGGFSTPGHTPGYTPGYGQHYGAPGGYAASGPPERRGPVKAGVIAVVVAVALIAGVGWMRLGSSGTPTLTVACNEFETTSRQTVDRFFDVFDQMNETVGDADFENGIADPERLKELSVEVVDLAANSYDSSERVVRATKKATDDEAVQSEADAYLSALGDARRALGDLRSSIRSWDAATADIETWTLFWDELDQAEEGTGWDLSDYPALYSYLSETEPACARGQQLLDEL
jgi:hypothetical protein